MTATEFNVERQREIMRLGNILAELDTAHDLAEEYAQDGDGPLMNFYIELSNIIAEIMDKVRDQISELKS